MGDVYPAYSSLRSDPLGTKALYESFQQCCGMKVSRNYEPFEALKDRRDAVVFFPGEEPPIEDMMPIVFVQDIESFLRNGGRLIVSYMQPQFDLKKIEEEQEKAAKKKEKSKKGKTKDEKEEEDKDMVSFSKRWGLRYREYPLADATEAKLAEESLSSELPRTLFWHTELYFDQLAPEWRVLYRREGKAVLIERDFGRGTVVLSADSYFLSNEAMLRHRYPKLLAWLAGDKRTVIFDEYFHGVMADPGVATLARRYHLHALVAGILLLTGLFIWRNSQSFVPPHPDSSSANHIAEGKDSTAGLTNLLRRSIASGDVLAVCWQEWKKSAATRAAGNKNQLERMESEYASRNDPVEKYNRISRILKQRS